MSDVTGIWVVTDGDYDSTWIVAAYGSKSLADEHVSIMGGYAEEVTLRSELHPDATDPAKVAVREAEAEASKLRNEATAEHWRRHAEAVNGQRPRAPHMRLCDCETFSSKPMWTEHGYCAYCGGWAPRVFLKHMGPAALQDAIGKLALHYREKMQAIVAPLSPE